VLNNPVVSLTKVEAKMIEMDTKRDNFGRIMYNNTKETLMNVRLQTIKNAILETQATDVEKYIMEMCRDREFEDAQGKKVESLNLSHDGGVNLDEEKENFAYTGRLADRKVSGSTDFIHIPTSTTNIILGAACNASPTG